VPVPKGPTWDPPLPLVGQLSRQTPTSPGPRATILFRQMDASGSGVLKAPGQTDAGLASDRDDAGVPVHRGWAPLGGRHRWMEPFVLVLLAGGSAHGYAITAQLEEMGITDGPARDAARRAVNCSMAASETS